MAYCSHIKSVFKTSGIHMFFKVFNHANGILLWPILVLFKNKTSFSISVATAYRSGRYNVMKYKLFDKALNFT